MLQLLSQLKVYLVVWVTSVSSADDNNSNDHGGHQGDAGEGQGHVDGAALLHLDATNGVSLKNKKQIILRKK